MRFSPTHYQAMFEFVGLGIAEACAQFYEEINSLSVVVQSHQTLQLQIRQAYQG